MVFVFPAVSFSVSIVSFVVLAVFYWFSLMLFSGLWWFAVFVGKTTTKRSDHFVVFPTSFGEEDNFYDGFPGRFL